MRYFWFWASKCVCLCGQWIFIAKYLYVKKKKIGINLLFWHWFCWRKIFITNLRKKKLLPKNIIYEIKFLYWKTSLLFKCRVQDEALIMAIHRAAMAEIIAVTKEVAVVVDHTIVETNNEVAVNRQVDNHSDHVKIVRSVLEKEIWDHQKVYHPVDSVAVQEVGHHHIVDVV